MIASTLSGRGNAQARSFRWVVDAFAYLLAAISLWPATWLLIAFGWLLHTIYVVPPGSSPGQLRSWRQLCFLVFSTPQLWCTAAFGLAATLLLAVIAIWLTRRRSRSGYRLAQYAGRLARLGIFLALAVISALGMVAFERFVR
jgi:hypothetical protein